jgi:hypothetical protein
MVGYRIPKRQRVVCSQLLTVEHRIWQPAGRGLLHDDLLLGWALVVEDDRAKGTVHVQLPLRGQFAVVVNEAQLVELIQKETDPGARGADHLGERFLADLRNEVGSLTGRGEPTHISGRKHEAEAVAGMPERDKRRE